MNKLKTLFMLFSLCYVVYGDNCVSSMTAFPPDPESGCCGVQAVGSSQILDGLKTNIRDYPWVATIEYVNGGKKSTPCYGALISGRYVLTVRYCAVPETKYLTGEPENVIFGEYDTKNDGPDCVTIESGAKECTDGITRIAIEKIIAHSDYIPKRLGSYKNDIALLRMAELAPYTEFIRPICLPTLDITQKIGPISLIKAGWGRLGSSLIPTNTKLHMSLPLFSLDECTATFPRAANITLSKGQICAGGENVTDFCRGDAGAPLSHNDGQKTEVIGILSFGTRSCMLEVPSVYTNIYEYISWIKNNIVD